MYFSIVGNMREFIEKDNNLDGREIYESIDDIKTKRIGALKGSAYNSNIFQNVTIYDIYDDLLNDLRTYKLDAIIVDNILSNYTQAFDMDITFLNTFTGMNFLGFGFQKEDTKYINEFNKFLAAIINSTSTTERYGLGFDVEDAPLELTGNNGIINAIFRMDIPPYSYREKDVIRGNEILLVYEYARIYGYKINLIEAKTLQDQVDCLQNKSCDIAGGLFPILDEYKDNITYSNDFYPIISGITIRYENSVKGKNPNKIFDMARDYNGQILGTLSDPSYYNLVQKNYPDSEIMHSDSFYDIFAKLLLGQIKGCLLDKPLVDYFTNKYPKKLSFYSDIFDENNYGFGFQKNLEGGSLLSEFNQFIFSNDIDSLYYKWTNYDITNLTIDTNLDSSKGKTINVGINMDFVPLGFFYYDQPKGYEFELVYMFARQFGYKVNFISLENDPQRISYLTEGKANITGGHFTITDERRNYIYFSEPILRSATVLSVAAQSKKELLTNIVIDENGVQKPNNNVDIDVKFGNLTKTSSCIFPKNFNDTIIINCTISNITENYTRFEYGNSRDKIKFMYYSFNATTFLNANTLLNNDSIINESNKSEIICQSIRQNDDENNSRINYIRINKSSERLSTGAIIAIIIPCILVLVIVIVFIFSAIKRTPPIKEKPSTNDSMNAINDFFK
jgi:ABC-type amino acid transport substrate-binding protein